MNLLDKMGFKGKLLKWTMRIWLIALSGFLEIYGLFSHDLRLVILGFANFVIVFGLMVFISIKLIEREHERLGYNN